MDFLKAEIAKRKLEAEKVSENGKKWFKRGKLEEVQPQESLPQNTQEETVKKPAKSTHQTNDSVPNMTLEEVIKRLRFRNQPITLFGETLKDRIGRLKILESAEDNMNGQRNDFKIALQATDQQNVLALLRDQQETVQAEESEESDDESVDTTLLCKEMLHNDPGLARNLLEKYLKRLIRLWGKELAQRPMAVKQTAQGKLQSATHTQTGEYLKPFFKILQNNEVDIYVLQCIVEICRFVQEREYQKANDIYLKLSIGNAPWPIGVTMVGIHDRSAREKISTSHVAHVLNDETQRKWIQSIKRLMTFAQTKWPPTDLSKLMG